MSPATPSDAERRAARLAELRLEIRKADGGEGAGRVTSPRQGVHCLVPKPNGMEPAFVGAKSPRHGVGKQTRGLSVDKHAKSAVLDFSPPGRMDPSDPNSPRRTWIRNMGGKLQTPHREHCATPVTHMQKRKLSEPRACAKERLSKKFGERADGARTTMCGSIQRARSPRTPRTPGGSPLRGSPGGSPLRHKSSAEINDRVRGKGRAGSPARAASPGSPFQRAGSPAPDKIFLSRNYAAHEQGFLSSSAAGGGGARFAASPRRGQGDLTTHKLDGWGDRPRDDLQARHYHYCKKEHRSTSLPPSKAQTERCARHTPTIRTFSPARAASPHTHHSSKDVGSLLQLDNLDGSRPAPKARPTKVINGRAPAFQAPEPTLKQFKTMKRGCPTQHPSWKNRSDVLNAAPAGEASGPSDDFLQNRPALASGSIQRARGRSRTAGARAQSAEPSVQRRGRHHPVQHATDPITHRFG